VIGEASHRRFVFRTLRQQGAEQMVRERVHSSTGKTEASRDLVILAKGRQIKELEAENRRLQQLQFMLTVQDQQHEPILSDPDSKMTCSFSNNS
jgi:hypothetical protein